MRSEMRGADARKWREATRSGLLPPCPVALLQTLVVIHIAAAPSPTRSKRREASRRREVLRRAEGVRLGNLVEKLIVELNKILAHDVVDEAGAWISKLEPESWQLFDFSPKAIQEQLLLERDPYGNVQVSKIKTELEKRKADEGRYHASFRVQFHFFVYEGRCGLRSTLIIAIAMH